MKTKILAGRRGWLQAGAAGPAAAAWPALAQDKPALQRIRERGSLVVGVYNEMPPFHAGGQGIDVALAGALARAKGQAHLAAFQCRRGHERRPAQHGC